MNYLRKGIILMVLVLLNTSVGFAAYNHHLSENDPGNFLSVYPDKAGSKLDSCALCHKGGQYQKNGKTVTLGSCQWCHYSYGYNGAGHIEDTINQYGMAYKNAGRNAAAISAVDNLDSDGDGYTNTQEITADAFPGNPNDYPGLKQAPFRIYTKAQLEAMPQHTEFLLMNTARSGDYYAQYTGVPMKDLLDDAGILPSATDIIVYSPDGFSWTHPLYYDENISMYHVYGNMPGQTYQYPPATYYYNTEADNKTNPSYGWCDYSAPSCVGRSNGDPIFVAGGLKAILAIKREGADLDPGVLNSGNSLDGEGPFRVVPPQKYVNAPDQSSKASNQDVLWPYNSNWDHNAGASTRTVTIIKVEPLPEGTTDIDILEAGWKYVDEEKLIIYGAVNAVKSPSTLSATAISSTQVALGWSDNSNNETGFEIEQMAGNCGSSDSWTQIATQPANSTTYTVSNLSPNTRYSFRVRAYNTDGSSSYSNCASSKTGLSGVPPSPTNLKATSASSIRINLSWTDNSVETGFKIYRKAGDDSWKLRAVTAANAVSYSDSTALKNNSLTSYSYYICSYNDAGKSSATNSAIVPFQPTNLRAAQGTTTGTITLTWQDKSNNETGFDIFRKSGPCSSTAAWAKVGTVGANSHVWTDTGLAAGNTYSYKVRAHNKTGIAVPAYGYSLWSNCREVTVGSLPE